MSIQPSADYSGVVVAAPYTETYSRYSDHEAPWFMGRTLHGLIQTAGIAKDDVDGLSFTSMSMAPDSAPGLVDQYGCSPRWLESVQCGGASGIIALQRAARAVQCGDADIVACIAGDMHKKGSFHKLASQFSRFAMDALHPYGAAGPNAVFALITRAYMERYGVRREDFGRLCVSQRRNAAGNPRALLRDPMSLDDYLAARPVVEPLHLFDCVMPCAGGEGFLLMSEDRARHLELPHARILGVIERHNAFHDDPVQLRGGWHAESSRLWEQAGIEPRDIDCVQTYDDYPVISFLQLEALGFAEEGGAASLFTDGQDFGSRHNTGGGQLSVGQVGFAGGFLGVVESLRRLFECGDRRGLVSGFGYVNFDRGINAAAAVLERGA